MSGQASPTPASTGALFSAALGWMLAVALVKLGNPVVLNHLILAPSTLGEWVFGPWPPAYGYPLLVVVLALAWPLARRGMPDVPPWLIWLPLAWLGWQIVACWGTLDRSLSALVVLHYASVVACYFMGLFSLSRVRNLDGFWLGLLVGFAWVLIAGMDQHHGGLAATRRWVYEQPDWQSLPPEYLARLASNRVFSTLFYANTLAGVVLLLLPALLVAGWRLWPERYRLYRAITTGLLLYAGIACLFWSGSKAGWLIAGAVGFVALLEVPLKKHIRITVALVVLGIVMIGFGIRFADYFERGATSAAARFDYWRVAVRIVSDNPVLGSGPGTFGHLYRELKPPEAEMSRVVHNDYLQQASDSGVPGALLFGSWIVGAALIAYRRSRGGRLARCVWLGFFAWSLQGLVEFGLLIPAVSWVGMVFLGWLVGAEHRDRQGCEEALPFNTR
jgi:hypothetical protein